MRAAQIGGDGILRDAEGLTFNKSRRTSTRPVRRVASASPRSHSGQRLFLGQEGVGSDLRRLVESNNYPTARPAQEFEIIRKFVGDSSKQIYPGRVVFPSADIDPSSVYVVSARPSPDGFIRLMKIVGNQGHWVDYPLEPSEGDARSFRRDFLVASPAATVTVHALYPVFQPVFENDPEKKPDSDRASVSYSRAVMVGAFDTMAAAPFSEASVRDVANRKGKVEELAPYVVTAFTVFREGLETAAAGYDTHYSGVNAAFYLMSTATQALKRLRRMAAYIDRILGYEEKIEAGTVGAGEVEKYYLALGEAMTEFLFRSRIWGLWMSRAVYYTNLTVLATPQLDLLNNRFRTAIYKFLEACKTNREEIIQKSGLTDTQVETALKPFNDYFHQTYIEGAEADGDFNTILGELKIDRNDWEAGFQFVKTLLGENEESLRRALRPSSVAVSVDPDVYKGLSGLAELSDLSGPVPVRIVRLLDAIKQQLYKRKAKIEIEIQDPARRVQADELFREDFYKPIRGIIAKELSSMLKWAEKEQLDRRYNEPEVLEALKRAERDPDVPEGSFFHKLSRKVNRGHMRAEEAQKEIETAAKVLGKLKWIEEQSKRDPYEASALLLQFDFVELYEKYPEMKAGKQLKAEEVAATFIKASRDADLDPLLAAETFRSKVAEEEGGPGDAFDARMATVLETLRDEIKANEARIREGTLDAAGNRVGELPNRAELERDNGTAREFIRYTEGLQEGRYDSELEAKITKERRAEDFASLQASDKENRFRELEGKISQIQSEVKDFFATGDPFAAYAKQMQVLVEYYDKLELSTKQEFVAYTGFKNTLSNYKAAYKVLRDAIGDKAGADLMKEIRYDYKRLLGLVESYFDAAGPFKKAHARLTRYRHKRLILGAVGRWSLAFGEWTFFLPLKLIDRVKTKFFSAGIARKIVESTFGLLALGAWSLSMVWLTRKVAGALKGLPLIGGEGGLLDMIYNITNKIWNTIWGLCDPGTGDITNPSEIVKMDAAKRLSGWEIATIAALVATVIAPQTVIGGAVKLVTSVAGGVRGIVTGKGKRGRPPRGKKGVGPGAPPNIQKAIEAVKKGRAQGNPFLVRKGQEALRKAKAMGIPVPPGYIDGLLLGW